MTKVPRLFNLSQRQDAFLRAEATRLGTTVTDLVRRILDERIEAERARGNPVVEAAVDPIAIASVRHAAAIPEAIA